LSFSNFAYYFQNPVADSGRLKEITSYLKSLQENPDWPGKRTLKSYNRRLASNKNAFNPQSTPEGPSYRSRSMKTGKNCSGKTKSIRTLPRPEDIRNLKFNQSARRNRTLPPLRKAGNGSADCGVTGTKLNTTRNDTPAQVYQTAAAEETIDRPNATVLSVNITRTSTESIAAGRSLIQVKPDKINHFQTTPSAILHTEASAGRSISMYIYSNGRESEDNDKAIFLNETERNQSSSDVNISTLVLVVNSSEPLAASGRSIQIAEPRTKNCTNRASSSNFTVVVMNSTSNTTKIDIPAVSVSHQNSTKSITAIIIDRQNTSMLTVNETPNSTTESTTAAKIPTTTTAEPLAAAGRSIQTKADKSDINFQTTPLTIIADVTPAGRGISKMYIYSNGREIDEDGNEATFPSKSTTSSTSSVPAEDTGVPAVNLASRSISSKGQGAPSVIQDDEGHTSEPSHDNESSSSVSP